MEVEWETSTYHLVRLTTGHLNRRAREAERRGQHERARAMRDAAQILRQDAKLLPTLRSPDYQPIRDRKVARTTPSRLPKEAGKNGSTGCAAVVVLLIAVFLLIVWGVVQSLPTDPSLTP